MNFARCYYDQIFPTLPLLVHVDADAVVVGDLAELVRSRRNASKPLAAAQGRNRLWLTARGRAEFPGMVDDFIHFNGGFFIANLDLWRRQGLGDRLRFIIKAEVPFYSTLATNPAQNLAFPDYERLSPAWNVHNLGICEGGDTLRCEEATNTKLLKSAKLLHWSGRCKPWVSEKCPHQALWARELPDWVVLGAGNRCVPKQEFEVTKLAT
eukprot:TRINITY_DN8234_c0_g1_i2.p1 TRINITY_DN8234_c0_g1~~TRINITY_DN8234_c0_g1_i2.p1  ORF type:complete len:210 (-),score=43.53 TRINITY_DN8234_c0_g1_i2:58-687(-)